MTNNPNRIVDSNPPVLIPQPGERAFIAGQTGSGKTAFANWLLRRVNQSPIIIYDTKEEPKFLGLPDVSIANNVKEVDQQMKDGLSDYIVFRPPLNISFDPYALDQLLYHHYINYHGVPAYVDEVYQFHNQGRPGPGLVALLTRGRSRAQTTILSAQRPAWLSKFVITESQRFYLFPLRYKPDRSMMGQAIPDFETLPVQKKHHFWFYEQGVHENPLLYSPIVLDKNSNLGYTDTTASDSNDANSKVLWV